MKIFTRVSFQQGVFRQNNLNSPRFKVANLAEREGFEPSDRFPGQHISSVLHSTALPPLPNRRFAVTGEQSKIVLACALHRTLDGETLQSQR